MPANGPVSEHESLASSLDTIIYRLNRIERSVDEKFDRVVYRDMYELRHDALIKRMDDMQRATDARETEHQRVAESARKQRIALAGGLGVAAIPVLAEHFTNIMRFLLGIH